MYDICIICSHVTQYLNYIIGLLGMYLKIITTRIMDLVHHLVYHVIDAVHFSIHLLLVGSPSILSICRLFMFFQLSCVKMVLAQKGMDPEYVEHGFTQRSPILEWIVYIAVEICPDVILQLI